MRQDDGRVWALVAGLFVLPILHPALIPLIGVPSHLLWWVHVLPVALVAFRRGRLPGGGIIAASAVSVLVGERVFGAGYGVAASWETAWALTIALLATHLLVAGFALYARRVSGRYRLLFENATSAILRTDADGAIIAANPAALQLFGCRVNDLLGKRPDEVEWLRDMPDPSQLTESGWVGSIRVGCSEDERVAHVAAAATASSDPPGHQILMVDRTSEVMQEQELERQGRLATLGGTLAGVAHELKNPLQVINGFAELGLAPGASDAELRESLETIQTEAARMTRLAKELLGFSRARDDREAIVVADVTERLARIHRLARGRAVQIRHRSTWTGSLRISAAKLEQVISNLLSNALDAVPAGQGLIEVGVDAVGEEVWVTVSDNGPGVNEALLHRIFDPFVTTKGENEGTGLGLAISRRLVRAMGGELSVENRAEGGARFTLRLPLADDELERGGSREGAESRILTPAFISSGPSTHV